MEHGKRVADGSRISDQAENRDDLQVRSEIREGGQTRPLDLKGRGERAIDRVELTYRAKPNFKGSAKVCVSGLT